MNDTATWHAMTAQVVSLLSRIGYPRTGAYLVGSQALRRRPRSDYDSVFLLNSDLGSLGHLQGVRATVDALLASHSVDSWYHYKLLGAAALENLAHEDGYRLASFQKAFVHHSGPDTLAPVRPRLDEGTFVNALVIQITYRFFFNAPNVQWAFLQPTLDRWVRINLDVHPVRSYREQHFVPSYFEDRSPLIAALRPAMTQKPTREWTETLDRYLTDYLHAFDHEAINKERWYRDRLASIPVG